MKKIIIFILIFIFLGSWTANAAVLSSRLSGRIILQVESKGEAWYVYPKDQKRYYLGRPADAFDVMRKLGLGVKHEFISNTEIFSSSLAGMILLDVESHGEAYYIDPTDLRKCYLGRPSDAFRIMREKGLGITNRDLSVISRGDVAEPITVSVSIKQEVPFTSQAPYGDWKDERQQDGCEEASALMAVGWARGFDLDQKYSLQEILAVSDYELKKYGEYRDVYAGDVVDWIFKDYFNFNNVELKNNISKQDIINELKKGNILLMPMDGQLLGNPYFTPPGPERHMLLVTGYDAEKRAFITNDPGTRRGRGFVYDEDVLYKAIRAYPTGYHEPILKQEKVMIIVFK